MLAILMLCLLGKSEGMGEPRYALIFDSPVHVLRGADRIDCSQIVCERYNDTTAVMHGLVQFLQPLGPGLILEVIIQKETSGKREVMVSHDICDLCDHFGNLESDYNNIMKHIDIPQSCPIVAGTFPINNLIVDLADYSIKDSHCGAYVAELFMYESTGDSCKNDRMEIICMVLNFNIEQI